MEGDKKNCTNLEIHFAMLFSKDLDDFFSVKYLYPDEQKQLLS